MFDGYFSGKRVFVTGATGFKGAWLTLWLAELGAEVTGYSLPPEDSPSLFEAARAKDSGRHLMADIADGPRLREAVVRSRPHVVLHLAAQSLVRRSYAQPVDTWRTNVMGTVNLLEACRGVEALESLVVVSSDKCYMPLDTPRPLREDDRLGGRDPYSASKACVEMAAYSYARSFGGELPPMASARAGNVVGGGDFAQDRLLPDCARALSRGDPVELRNPGHVRPWQHVLEPLAGYLRLCAWLAGRDRPAHEGWNFAPEASSQVEVAEVAGRFARLWGGGHVRIAGNAGAPGETASLLLDNSKARERLGWSPRLGLDETLAWTAHWYRAFFQGADARELCLGQIRGYMGLP